MQSLSRGGQHRYYKREERKEGETGKTLETNGRMQSFCSVFNMANVVVDRAVVDPKVQFKSVRAAAKT